MADKKRCQICLGLREGEDVSFLFCAECRDMISRIKGYNEHLMSNEHWWTWAREKKKFERAVNILKYGEYKWQM